MGKFSWGNKVLEKKISPKILKTKLRFCKKKWSPGIEGKINIIRFWDEKLGFHPRIIRSRFLPAIGCLKASHFLAQTRAPPGA
jgi:hypothetical protein